MRRTLGFFAAAIVASAMTAGCGGDDVTDVVPDSGGADVIQPDAPKDGPIIKMDGPGGGDVVTDAPKPPPDTGVDSPGDGPGGIGTLAGFVIDLVDNKTAENSEPVDIEGKTLTDTEDEAVFNKYFP